MKESLTHIVFILDRSGSMNELLQETIDGYNGFIKEQKSEDGEAWLTTVLFSDEYKLLHDHVDIMTIPPITRSEYVPQGRTALYDAIGKAVDETGAFLSSLAEFERPAQVLVVIITDGYENASTIYSREDIHRRIRHQTDVYSWRFIFLGANIDSEREAASIGIAPDFAMNFIPSPQGTARSFQYAAAAASMARRPGRIMTDWKNADEGDVKT